jgi:hypothetical protein
MTGAIASVALRYGYDHTPAAAASNPLYKPWVKDIDIAKLLQTQDLQAPNAEVVSILDSTALLDILQTALDYQGPRIVQRPYLDPAVRFIFTQGNLRGIPYFLAMRGNTLSGLGMRAHTDYQSYWVCYGAAVPPARADDIAVSFPNAGTTIPWHGLGMAAVASGAFPIGLSPRLIERNAADYRYRFVVVPGDSNQPSQLVQLKPNWNPTSGSPTTYSSVVVDGGTMDNEPLELARTELAGLLGRNPRDGTLANRATLLVDPFPDLAGTVDDPSKGQKSDLLSAAVGLMGAWKDQARFNPVDLALAGDENVYSRFLISPDRGGSSTSNGFDLACGALGGFSGFLSERYRHHDYMLGRRNCQQFLRSHFHLPINNVPVFADINPALKNPSSPWVSTVGGVTSLPIIPLMKEVDTEEVLPGWPKGAFDPESLRAPASARVGAIVDRVLRTSVHLNWFFTALAKLGLARVRSTAIDKAVSIVAKELKLRALI